ncbi:MAG: hypothetical protein WCF85_17775, partial [Rhodospirillaceae bacterium]
MSAFGIGRHRRPVCAYGGYLGPCSKCPEAEKGAASIVAKRLAGPMDRAYQFSQSVQALHQE